ncbi:hypothetical protein FHW68_000745 [Pseudomonas sp. Tn43]|nr:hypothetical protein [Pseudomonas sp. Tn43]PAU60944.1 hypothetical protein BZL43_05655 [Pseudomonas sp. PICF141]
MAEVIGVLQAMAAQSVLVTSALATQGHANVHLDGRVYPLSLYLLTMAAFADRKTAVAGLAASPRMGTPAMAGLPRKTQSLARHTCPNLRSRWQRSIATPTRQSDRARARSATTDLTKSLCLGLPSMGLFSDEGGQFLGSSTMSRDNRLKAVTTPSSAWDGNPIDHSRSMAGESLRAYDRRLSLHLMLPIWQVDCLRTRCSTAKASSPVA